jgi:hypothetical protein
MNIYYVYVYLDPRKTGKFIYKNNYAFDEEPFYVGEGKENRYFCHIFEALRNDDRGSARIHRIKQIKKDTGKFATVIKYKENLEEHEACSLEKDMIKSIGRYDLGYGPLLNLSNGGIPAYNYEDSEIIDEQEIKKIEAKGIQKMYSFSETCSYFRIEAKILRKWLKSNYITPAYIGPPDNPSISFSNIELEKIMYIGLQRGKTMYLNPEQLKLMQQELQKVSN